MSTSGRSFRNTTERMVQILSYHLFLIVFVVVTFPVSCWAQYEDVRCKCICPNASVVGSQSGSNRKLYIKNVVPQRCNCEGVVMPHVDTDLRDKAAEFCPRCECKYEIRNTMTIRVCVILLICVVALLTLYMAFLRCLEPLLNKRRGGIVKYEEHLNEDVNLGDFGAHDGNISSEGELQLRGATRVRSGSGVLDKVGAQQDRWKRQVQEQRRNIYDKRTMLN